MDQNLSIESLRAQHAVLDEEIRKEESYVWKNLDTIKKLKEEKLRKKDELLRRYLQSIHS